MEEKLDFGHMMERDIDLFLLYSFALDSDFLRLFTNQVKRQFKNPKVVGVEISREEHNLGESDVTVHIKDEEHRHAILIEDKIGAAAQPDQCARYYKRAEINVNNGEYDDFDVFICAPHIYIESDPEASKYEYSVSFEEIEEYLSNKNDAFSKLRLDEIRYTLYSPKSNYISIPDENATALWVAYQNYVRESYPDLALCNTVGYKPKGGSWIEFKTPFKSQDKVCLMHKVDRGQIDLQFGKLGKKTEELAKILQNQLGDYEKMGFEVVPASQSASLRKDLGRDAAINFDQSFESQKDIIKEQVYWINELNNIAKDLDIEEILKLRPKE